MTGLGAADAVFCPPAHSEQGGSGRCPWDEPVCLGGRAKAHFSRPVCPAAGPCGEGAGYFAESYSQIGDWFGLSHWACDQSLWYKEILAGKGKRDTQAGKSRPWGEVLEVAGDRCG